ncbi:MAG: holdfast anchor protein HfaD [Hyphomonadaceae bacterium]|nr:holdfast anchor protein HfaD [Hyphomonadaceae bacterium]
MDFARRLAFAASAAALFAAPVSAQQAPNTSGAINDQLNWGDVFSNMLVVSRGDARAATSSATSVGNAVSGANLVGGLTASSTQANTGAIFAWSEVDAQNTREAVAIATSQGNAAQAQTVDGDLALDGAQTSGPGDAFAGAKISAANTRTISAGASTANNNFATAAENGDLTVNLAQTSSGSSYAVVDVDAGRSRDTVAGASAAGNAYGSSSYTSTANADYAQTSTGPQVYASTAVDQVQARNVTAASTATANSAGIDNQWGYAQIRGRQANTSSVYTESSVTLGTWNGAALVSSNGVGNSTLATNVGSDMALDVAQQNDGSVISGAFFEGSGSGDAVVASTAIGNAITGYVCSQCGDAVLAGTTSQTNTGNIASTGTINATTSGQLIGSASAIGNSATFITTSRNN